MAGRQKTPQAPQGFGLDLSDSLAGHAVNLPYLLKRQRVAVCQAEPKINDAGLHEIFGQANCGFGPSILEEYANWFQRFVLQYFNMYIPEVLFSGLIALQSWLNYLSALTSTISNPLYSPFSTI